MDKVISLVLRHVIMMFVSAATIYVVVLSFGGHMNYFEWSGDSHCVFGLVVNFLAIVLHVMFYAVRDNEIDI